MFKKLIGLHHDQKGMTGLETAIILIAFVVVAAVFAYTVLSAGLFATQKSQEAVYSGLEEVQSTLKLNGGVTAYADKRDGTESVNIDSDGTPGLDPLTDALAVAKVQLTVSTASSSGEAIVLTPPYEIEAGTGALVASGGVNSTQIAFSDENQFITDCAWTLDWVGKHTDDSILDNDEKAIITVYLVEWDGSIYALGTEDPFISDVANLVGARDTFTLEVKPPSGAVLTMERTMPPRLDTVMNLR